jgi:hypothetical protein
MRYETPRLDSDGNVTAETVRAWMVGTLADSHASPYALDGQVVRFEYRLRWLDDGTLQVMTSDHRRTPLGRFRVNVTVQRVYAVTNHRYTPGHSGMACVHVVERDGAGEDCGLPASEHDPVTLP